MSKMVPYSYLYMSFIFFGSLLSISSSHWLAVWAGFEINLMGFLPAIVFNKKISESESGVKYYIVQALGSVFLLVGSLSYYSLTMSWNMSLMSMDLGISLFIFLGLIIKMGGFPFYFWLPPVMVSLSWFLCFVLITWQKLAPLVIFSELSSVVVGKEIFFLVFIVSAGSSLVGGLGGMNQTQIRALLAYSSIGHLGWMIYAACLGLKLVVLYFLIYVLISLTIFYSLMMINSMSMSNLVNLSKSVFYLAVLMLGLLSLAGIPPLVGFVPKWLVILGSSFSSSLPLLGFLVLGSLFNLYYYLCLSFFYFMKLVGAQLCWSSKVSVLSLLIIFFNALGGVFMGIFALYWYALVIFNKS